MIKTRPFDPARYIGSREDAGHYLDAVLADGDAEDLVDALDVIARALGAPEPHLPCEADFQRIARALEQLGFRLSAQPAAVAAA